MKKSPFEINPPLKTSWTPPKLIESKPLEYHEKVRAKNNILVEGDDPTPALTSFQAMKFPKVSF